jgi:hypothetical protein
MRPPPPKLCVKMLFHQGGGGSVGVQEIGAQSNWGYEISPAQEFRRGEHLLSPWGRI